MTKKHPTLISVVLDRSGSMETIRHGMIKGFNAFLREQRNVKGKTRWSMWQFDGGQGLDLDEVYRDLKGRDVPKLGSDAAPFQPRGMTPLLDALGTVLPTINVKDGQLSVVVIITDGLENYSREFTREQIQKLVKDREDAGWQFVYLGANQDAFGEAQALGMAQAVTADYEPTTDSAEVAFAAATTAVSSYRESGGQRMVGHMVADAEGATSWSDPDDEK